MNNIEETLDEIKALIKEHTKRDNVFTVYMLEKCLHYVSLLQSFHASLVRGNVLVTPVSIGDMVYTNRSVSGWNFKKKDALYKGRVVFIGINGEDDFMNVYFGNGKMQTFSFGDIGKSVFLEGGVQK